MKEIKFCEYNKKITKVIQEKLNENPICEEKDFFLIQGFFNYPIQQEIAAGEILIDGITVPMVAIVGKKTGRIYFFHERHTDD
jgi:hypothetical protein